MLDEMAQKAEDRRIQAATPYRPLQFLELVKQQQEVPAADRLAYLRQEYALEGRCWAVGKLAQLRRRHAEPTVVEREGDLGRQGQEEVRQPRIQPEALAVQVD